LHFRKVMVELAFIPRTSMSLSNCDISLILPAYNEAKTIRTTLTQAVAYFRGRSLRYEIIVAADGEDGTREAARDFAKDNAGVRVIGEPARSGKGRGIRDGVKIATGSIIGFADADNKVPISEFDKFEPLLRDGYQVVIGSRALGRSRIERRQPWYRRVGAQGFYFFLHAVTGSPGVADTQCGFKFFPSEIAKDLFARQQIDGYMFDVEILILAQRLGYRVVEVPIRWRDDGDSRLELLSGNLRNVADIFRIRLSCARLSKVAPAVRAKATNG
jgi:dolichyl-phosphate beta-glucosyltransferase